jgi:hypothetical protein
MKKTSAYPQRAPRRSWPWQQLAIAGALLVVLVVCALSFSRPAAHRLREGSGAQQASKRKEPRFDANTRRTAGPVVVDEAERSTTVEARPEPKVVEEREPLDGTPSVTPELGDPGPGPHIEYYQGRSGRLSPNAPIGGSQVPVQSSSAEQRPVLLVQAKSLRVNAGESMMLSAALVDSGGKRTLAQAMTIAIFPHDSPASRLEATMMPNGDEHRFEFKPPAQAGQDTKPPQQYEFVVHAQGAGYERSANGLFFVQYPSAKIDSSSSKVDRQQGDIELEVTVQIQKAGNYFATAELWGGAEGARPIAFARQRLERAAEGAQRIKLLFGGKVIRDSGVDGPYVVRNVQLLSVDSIPPNQSEPVAELDPTPAWHASDFY